MSELKPANENKTALELAFAVARADRGRSLAQVENQIRLEVAGRALSGRLLDIARDARAASLG
jgi:hypothetical protein